MLNKSSNWELGFAHYIAKSTISRLVISRLNVLFCGMSSFIELSTDEFCETKGQKSIEFC